MMSPYWFLALVCLTVQGKTAQADSGFAKDNKTPIRVTRDFVGSEEISPLQYGQFVEYLCNLVPGMWAEKLYDGSFEGLSPYRVAFLRETDFREKPWYPSGAANRGDFSLDPKNPISGLVSKKIEVREAVPCTVGISQDGIAVERGKACTFSCYLRQKGIQKPIQVRLHHEGELLAACEFQAEPEWSKFRALLKPPSGSPPDAPTLPSPRVGGGKGGGLGVAEGGMRMPP